MKSSNKWMQSLLTSTLTNSQESVERTLMKSLQSFLSATAKNLPLLLKAVPTPLVHAPELRWAYPIWRVLASWWYILLDVPATKQWCALETLHMKGYGVSLVTNVHRRVQLHPHRSCMSNLCHQGTKPWKLAQYLIVFATWITALGYIAQSKYLPSGAHSTWLMESTHVHMWAMSIVSARRITNRDPTTVARWDESGDQRQLDCLKVPLKSMFRCRSV